MKIIDRKNIETLRIALDAAVKAVGEQHGVSIKVARGKYSNGPTGSFNIEIATINADGSVESREAQDFRAMAGLYGFQPDDLGRTFYSHTHGKTYTITGLRARASKHPILAKDESGKVFCFSEQVAKLVKRPEEAA